MRIGFDNYVIETCEGVYEPAEDSFALIDAMDRVGLGRGKFLDLGCGTGIVGIHASLYGADVIFSDINPAAVRCAARNASINGIRADFVVGDLMSRLSRVDYVAFNPPYLPGEPEDLLGLSRAGGYRGTDVILRFVRELHKVRRYALLLTTEFNDREAIAGAAESKGFHMDLVLERVSSGEKYYVWLLYADSPRTNLNSSPGGVRV